MVNSNARLRNDHQICVMPPPLVFSGGGFGRARSGRRPNPRDREKAQSSGPDAVMASQAQTRRKEAPAAAQRSPFAKNPANLSQEFESLPYQDCVI